MEDLFIKLFITNIYFFDEDYTQVRICLSKLFTIINFNFKEFEIVLWKKRRIR